MLVGWLSCAPMQFGIASSCQVYREKGRKDSYTYLIDPDGPPAKRTDSGRRGVKKIPGKKQEIRDIAVTQVYKEIEKTSEKLLASFLKVIVIVI